MKNQNAGRLLGFNVGFCWMFGEVLEVCWDKMMDFYWILLEFGAKSWSAIILGNISPCASEHFEILARLAKDDEKQTSGLNSFNW